MRRRLSPWEDVLEAVKQLTDTSKDVKQAWEKLYGQEYQESEVAPVQQPEEKKAAPRKEQKVTRAKTERGKQSKPEDQTSPAEEQIPGQDTILNHQECLPDDFEWEEVEEEDTEKAVEQEAFKEPEELPAKAKMPKEEREKRRKEWRRLLEEEIRWMKNSIENGLYEAAKKSLPEIGKYLEELSSLEEETDEE